MLDQLLSDIRRAYRSFENPSWAFVQQRYEAHMHREVVALIRSEGEVIETTDLNEDLALCLAVGGQGTGLTVRLSLVGKYACVHDGQGRFLSSADLAESTLGNELLKILNVAEIVVFASNQLAEKIRFANQSQNLYAFLFSDDGLISSPEA